MKYFVAYVIPSSPALARHNFLTFEIKKHFGKSRETPAHITLKSPFEQEDISGLESALESFAKAHKKEPIRFSGFGHFDEETVYVDIAPSPDALRLIAELDEELAKIPWIKFDKYELPRKLHATLVHKNIADKFDDIWRFLSKEKFDFESALDNLAILKKEDGRWVLHKQYPLQ